MQVFLIFYQLFVKNLKYFMEFNCFIFLIISFQCQMFLNVFDYRLSFNVFLRIFFLIMNCCHLFRNHNSLKL